MRIHVLHVIHGMHMRCMHINIPRKPGNQFDLLHSFGAYAYASPGTPSCMHYVRLHARTLMILCLPGLRPYPWRALLLRGDGKTRLRNQDASTHAIYQPNLFQTCQYVRRCSHGKPFSAILHCSAGKSFSECQLWFPTNSLQMLVPCLRHKLAVSGFYISICLRFKSTQLAAMTGV